MRGADLQHPSRVGNERFELCIRLGVGKYSGRIGALRLPRRIDVLLGQLLQASFFIEKRYRKFT